MAGGSGGEKHMSELKPQSFEPAPQNMTISIFKFYILRQIMLENN